MEVYQVLNKNKLDVTICNTTDLEQAVFAFKANPDNIMIVWNEGVEMGVVVREEYTRSDYHRPYESDLENSELFKLHLPDRLQPVCINCNENPAIGNWSFCSKECEEAY